MKETVGFIGLGGMGLAMATNLLKAGFGLRVYNRTPRRPGPCWERERVSRCAQEAALAAGVDGHGQEGGGQQGAVLDHAQAGRPGGRRRAGRPGRRPWPSDSRGRWRRVSR